MSVLRCPRRLPHWLLCLALLALLGRALLPTGFMPDAGALHDGKLVLTFCTASGERTSLILDTGAHDTEAAPADCLFALAGAPALPLQAATSTVPALGSGQPASFALHLSAPPLPAAGPPLGSRAPPHGLG